jgi:hypothetical protein
MGTWQEYVWTCQVVIRKVGIMDTRDPLRIDCPRCGAKAGQLCKSKTGPRMCHKERRTRRRKPKASRSAH